MTCPACKKDKCYECVDLLLELAGRKKIGCTCTRQGHNGTEPNATQVADPFTGAVHAPGLVVHRDGQVERLPGTESIPSVLRGSEGGVTNGQ